MLNSKAEGYPMTTIVLVIIVVIAIAVILIFSFGVFGTSQEHTGNFTDIGQSGALQSEWDTCCTFGIGCDPQGNPPGENVYGECPHCEECCNNLINCKEIITEADGTKTPVPKSGCSPCP